ncbi:MAG: hypothetical protein PUC23_03595 [bacterium]|nr:hypothetical protein [bacterium]
MNKLFRRLFPDKERRAFNKMHRRHRKELVKHAKETGEWDWGWLHDSIIMQIKHMHEYYTERNNVWQSDETRLRIIEQLNHILDLDKEINRMQCDRNGVEFIHEGGKCTAIYPDNYKERVEKWIKREQELYEEIYNSIGKNIRWWWD